MSTIVWAAIVGIPLAWHLGLTGVAYYDAGRVGMPRKKWATITFLVPIFGFFTYLFERSELSYDPEEDPYRGNNFNIHPSRADDTVLPSKGEANDLTEWDGRDRERDDGPGPLNDP
ncbi:hypothetical protein ACFQGT_07595 [Natrialbaceae archaeon GCM10025810]|uniref:hypothetical protein n=1 Tax=Halovalidus salilacus TaxID=3075124 RepID=UPI00360A1729